MKTDVLLLAICFLPALAGILATRPLWRVRTLSNETIQCLGLVVLIGALIGCLLPFILSDDPTTGIVGLLMSLCNLLIFQYYGRRLNTSRCPQCHTQHLHIHDRSRGTYKLYCSHCGLHSRWRHFSGYM